MSPRLRSVVRLGSHRSSRLGGLVAVAVAVAVAVVVAVAVAVAVVLFNNITYIERIARCPPRRGHGD